MSKRIKPEYYTAFNSSAASINNIDAISAVIGDVLAEHYGVNVDSLEFTIEARYTVVEL